MHFSSCEEGEDSHIEQEIRPHDPSWTTFLLQNARNRDLGEYVMSGLPHSAVFL